MKITATHNPPAHDDLRLQESEPFCRLTDAMIVRAFRDATGRVGTEHNLSDQARYAVMTDGKLFFKDGRFEFWCDLLGIDYDSIMARLFSV